MSASASMAQTLRQPVAPFNRAARKSVQTQRHFRTTSSFIPTVNERICRDWLRGVSELSLSKMYQTTREVIEQTVRAQVVMMLARKTAYAVSLMLACICGYDLWQYAAHDDGAAIQRAFRARSRKTRRDGEVADSVWQDPPADDAATAGMFQVMRGYEPPSAA